MPRFEYKARNSSGALIKGVVDAGSSDALAGELFAQNMTPIEIKQTDSNQKKGQGEELTGIAKINAFLAGQKVPPNELIVFARQMQSLMRAGLPLDRALNGLQASLKNPLFKSILQDVLQGLESGLDLAAALGRHPKVFNPLFLSLVSVGENTGRLDMAFEQIGRYLELEKSTAKQVKSATRYPIFVVLTIAAAMVIITIFVIPAFADTFQRLQAELPIQTRILIAISDFAIAYWPYVLGGSLALSLGVRNWVKTTDGRLKWDQYKMRLPVAGAVFEQIALARFSRAFAMILRAGVPIVHGMSIVAGAVGNAYVAKRILGMQEGITRGESLYNTANSSQMFTPLVMQMISVGEESGTIDDLMFEVADFYDSEVEYNIKQLSEAIEPILIVFIAGMVLVLALGVFLPIWDLSAAAR